MSLCFHLRYVKRRIHYFWLYFFIEKVLMCKSIDFLWVENKFETIILMFSLKGVSYIVTISFRYQHRTLSYTEKTFTKKWPLTTANTPLYLIEIYLFNANRIEIIKWYFRINILSFKIKCFSFCSLVFKLKSFFFCFLILSQLS